jgi:hypothetical protein
METLCQALEDRVEQLFALLSPVPVYNIVDDLKNKYGLVPYVLALPSRHESVFSNTDTEYKFHALCWLLSGKEVDADPHIAWRQWAQHITRYMSSKDVGRELAIVHALIIGVRMYERNFKHRPVSERKFVQKYLKYGLERAINNDNV